MKKLLFGLTMVLFVAGCDGPGVTPEYLYSYLDHYGYYVDDEGDVYKDGVMIFDYNSGWAVLLFTGPSEFKAQAVEQYEQAVENARHDYMVDQAKRYGVDYQP